MNKKYLKKVSILFKLTLSRLIIVKWNSAFKINLKVGIWKSYYRQEY